MGLVYGSREIKMINKYRPFESDKVCDSSKEVNAMGKMFLKENMQRPRICHLLTFCLCVSLHFYDISMDI